MCDRVARFILATRDGEPGFDENHRGEVSSEEEEEEEEEEEILDPLQRILDDDSEEENRRSRKRKRERGITLGVKASCHRRLEAVA